MRVEGPDASELTQPGRVEPTGRGRPKGKWRDPDGKGKVDHERSKVLLLVHADTVEARRAVQEVIATYRSQFEQRSVLWESSRVCVSS